MKKVFYKRFFILLLALIATLSTTTYAFAADMSSTVSEQNTVVSRANTAVTTTVYPNESKTLKVHLDMYMGLSKDFMLSATSDAKAGMIIVHLYNPLGNLVSNDWMIGINETVKTSIFAAMPGDWTLVVASNCPDGPVKVSAKWVD